MDNNFNESSNYLIEVCKQSLPYITTFALAMFGGLVKHVSNLRNTSKSFKLREFVFDLIVSSFAGLLMYFLCKEAGVSDFMSAILIAISGHMGTQAIVAFENLYSRIVGNNLNGK